MYHNSRRKGGYTTKIGNNDAEPLLGSSSARGISTSTAMLVVGLVLFVAATIGLSIALGIVDNRPIYSAPYGPNTVPQQVHDLYKEFWERASFGDATHWRYPSFSATRKYVPSYTNVNTTARLPFLDMPVLLDHVFADMAPRVRAALATKAANDGMPEPLKESVRKTFLRRGLYEDLTEFIPQPAKCADVYRVQETHSPRIYLNAFADLNPISLSLLGPGFTTQEFPGIHPIYDTVTFDGYIQQTLGLRNMLIQARTGQFYERADAYLFATYGVHYPDFSTGPEVGDTLAAVFVGLNPSNLSGGSSFFYDSVIFRSAEYGYTLNATQLTILANITQVLYDESLLFLDYQLNAFGSMTLFDTSAAPGPLSKSILYYKAFPNSIHADCFAKLLVPGASSRNPAADFARLKDEFLAQRAIAEPILIAMAPDYLGWNLTWVHVFFGTEAGITELGHFAPVDCPNGDLSDPAALRFRENSIRVQNYYPRVGSLGVDHSAVSLYFGNLFGGCDTSFGNAFVTNNFGDYEHFPSVISLNGPLQPRENTWGVQIHEQVHVNQIGSLITQCPTCYMYRLWSPLIGFDSQFVREATALEGGATYVEREGILTDMRTGIRGSGSLEEAAHAMAQMLIRTEFTLAYYGVGTGLETALQLATFIEANHWFPSGSVSAAEGLYQRIADSPTVSGFGTAYRPGSDRFEVLRNRTLAACPEHVKRVYDANMVHTHYVSVAEHIIDDFLASGCKVWPYEQDGAAN
jgi:hypothetical protein